MSNIFEAIRQHGHDEDFDGDPTNQRFTPTDAPPGSERKIEVLRYRAIHGCPLWHPNDQKQCDRETIRQHATTGDQNPTGVRTVGRFNSSRKMLSE